MHSRERLVNTYLAQRLRRIRRGQRISLPDLARRVGLPFNTCLHKETGVNPVGFDYLLRFQFVTGLPINGIWFPVSERIECLDDEVIRSLLQRLSEQHREPTEQDVIEIAASIFQVPSHAIKDGFQQHRIVQARTAAALVAQSHPLLSRAKLARLVRREPSTLGKSKYRAEKYGPDFWRKLEAVQAEVESL